MQQSRYNVSSTLAVLKWIAAGILSIWASLSATVHLLCALMFLDFFTGLTGALVLRKLNADISFRGIAKKVMILTLVYVGHMITKPLNVGFDLGEMIALAFVVNEVLSIIENCVEVGVPIPPILVQTLSKVRSVMPEKGDSITVITQTETVVIPPVIHTEKGPKVDDKL